MSRFRCLAVLILAIGMSRTLSAQNPIGVTKLGVAAAIPGTNMSYTIHVTNPDGTSAANVQLNDTLPPQMTFVSAVQNSGPAFNPCTTPPVGSAGTVTCTAAIFPGGNGDAVFTFTFHIPSSATGSTSNTATVSTTSTDSAGDNTATISHLYQPEADLGVTKTGPAFVISGTNITYTIDVTNFGPSNAQSITLSDPLFGRFQSITQTSGPAFSCMTPAVGAIGTVSCTTATLPAGITASFQLVEKSDPNGNGPFQNQVYVASPTVDPGPSPNFANTSTPVRQDADLQVSKVGPLTATAGQPTITYTITAANNGPSDAVNISLNDALPATLTFQSLTQSTGPMFVCFTPSVGSSGSIFCSLS